jgi:diguanylate cyclase (GGDEF)-like protein
MDNHNAQVKNLLDQLIANEQLTVLFQPIVNLDKQSVYGYEGLIRGPAHSSLHDPQALFAAAAKHHRLTELDYLCRKTIIRQFAKLKLSGHLFINVDPATLTSEDFIRGQTLGFLHDHKLDPARVIIEITETHPIKDLTVFQLALRHYREMGFKVALDDLGAGYSSLKLWSELNPDFVKIDKHFIHDVDEDRTKRQFVKSIMEIAKALECQVITEGIERKNEYAMLRNLGVNLVQGFYFAMPKEMPDTLLAPQLFSQRHRRHTPSDRLTAVSLVRDLPIVSSQVKVEEVGELFRVDENIRSIAVVESGAPLGLVLRTDLMNILASRYGRDLHGRKPIKNFLKRQTLKIDVNTPLEDVSRALTNAVDHHTEEFIVVSEGRLVGKGLLLDLLSSITDMQVNKARYSNPLTLLPGNVLIQQKLDEFLQNDDEFLVAYCDLDNFKAYNDVYGYLRGDDLIRLVSRLLLENSDPELDFVGHIGGDDFIVLFRSADWRDRCQRLLQTFELLAPDYYTEADRSKGGIDATDRYGQKCHYPFVALSIGILPVAATRNGLSKELIAEHATIAKKKAKQYSGNSLYVETGEELLYRLAAFNQESGFLPNELSCN